MNTAAASEEVKFVDTPLHRRRVAHVVDALRSGLWPQTSDQLQKVPSFGAPRYCCLGVFTEIAILHDPDVASEIARAQALYKTPWGWWGSLPKSVAEWYGLEANPILVLPDGGWVSAAKANDVLGLSFDDIADMFACSYLSPDET